MARALPFRTGRLVTAANTWRQNYDALRWLDIPRAVNLIEQERRGVLSETQWVYELIEQSDPDMIALVGLRTAAIARLQPDIVTVDPKTAGFDKVLAAEQEKALSKIYGDCNTADAIAHLAGATFRGFTILQIVPDAEGLPARFEFLDRWLFARDGYRGAWWWNPQAATLPGGALPQRDKIGGEELPESGFVIRKVSLFVDRVAIITAVRSSLCEKDWDSWCEMYGLNQAIITEPPNAATEDRPAYDSTARAFSDGQGGTIPHGAAVTFPQTANAGTPPFKDRADYLTGKKVLAGTSGRLTMLAEAGSGTLAGGAHQETFDALADAEAAEISAVFNRGVTKNVLEALFPGRPALAQFALVRHAEEDKDANADRIAKVAPYFEIDPAEAGELTGLRITAAKALPSEAPYAPTFGAALHSESASSASSSAISIEGAAVDALSEARAANLAPVIDRLLDALSETDEAAMRLALTSLYADLPRLAIAAGATAADTELVERILSDAVGSGYASAAKKENQ